METEVSGRVQRGSRLRVVASLGLCLGTLAFEPTPSAAQGVEREEPRRYLLAEPTGYTSVLDAFVDPVGSPVPDFRVALSYLRTQSLVNIGREQQPADSRVAGSYRRLARSEQVTHALSLDLAVGLYRDLMLYGRMPLVLSDKRSLMHRAGSGNPTAEPEDSMASAPDATSGALFQHNFRSATRSGVPGFDIGVAWGLSNQYRTAYLPTWVVRLESRIGLGRRIEPCQANFPCSTGVSRGTIALAIDSRWSYRFRWLEPYMGLRYMREWATSAHSRFTPDGVPDALDTGLPSTQELTLGAAVMAWEERGRFQRLSIDVRGQAAYVSAGRDYSPLFDVLGLSSNVQLAAANESSRVVPFYGITQVGSHARFRAELALAAQAARYVEFRVGVSFVHATAHLLSGAPACMESGVSQAQCAPEQLNPLYRAAIDMPGQRFMQLGNFSYDLFATATGQF